MTAKGNDTLIGTRSNAVHNCVRFPKNWFRRFWICVFLRRRQWKLARAATKLLCYAFNSLDETLIEAMQPVHDRLWREVYAEVNEPALTLGGGGKPTSKPETTSNENP